VVLLSDDEDEQAESQQQFDRDAASSQDEVDQLTESLADSVSVSDSWQQRAVSSAAVPPVKPTRHMLQVKAKAFAAGKGSMEVLQFHKLSNLEMTRYHIRCLETGEWLNDEVINMYMGMLQEREMNRRLEGKSGLAVHFFNTFFLNKLYTNTGKYDCTDVLKWTKPNKLKKWKRDNILCCDRLVVPVHLPNHWTCAVIDLANEQIFYYDSMGAKDKDICEALAKYVADEAKAKKNEDIDTSEWPVEFPAVPRQLNGVDCGMFTILFAEYASRGASFSFSQAHIEYFRVKVLCDIMQGYVDYPEDDPEDTE
jgi:Ulp1 family protease